VTIPANINKLSWATKFDYCN